MLAKIKIQRLIAEIDALIAMQLSLIISQHDLQQLHASWAGLFYLIKMTSQTCQLKILSMSLSELNQSCTDHIDYQHSELFQKIYSDEFDHAGGSPFGIILVDYDNLAIATILILAKIAASAFLPIILPFSAEIYSDFRKCSEANFIAIINTKIRTNSNVTVHAAYFYLAITMQAFIQSGWFLMMYEHKIAPPYKIISYPWHRLDNPNLCEEIASQSEIKKFKQQGVITLGRNHSDDSYYFHHHRSTTNQLETVDQKISAELPYLLSACRFAHYIKIIGRNLIGQYYTASSCETILQNWILNYCANTASNNLLHPHKYPLKNAKITVIDNKQNPGHFQCTIDLVLHYGILNLNATISLVSTMAGSS